MSLRRILSILGFAISVYGQRVVHPWTEEENEQIAEWWSIGVLTDDNFPRFLESLKKEAHHPDRLNRALRRTESRSPFVMSGVGFGVGPLQVISMLVLTVVFILLIGLSTRFVQITIRLSHNALPRKGIRYE